MQALTERWASIPGFEGRYEVSDIGRVRSVSREFVRSDGHRVTVHGRILKVGLDTHGYPRLAIKNESGTDGRTYLAVHRAVLFAFAPQDGCEQLHVNHKNGNRSDNRLENLEWCTNAYNRLHSYRVLGRKNPQAGKTGALHHNSRPVIGKNIETGEIREYPALASTRRDGFRPRDVGACAHGTQKSAGGWIWRFANESAADWEYRPSVPTRHLKPVIRVAEDGTQVRYPSATAARADGFNNVAIGHVLHGRALRHGGYFWRYADLTEDVRAQSNMSEGA